MNKCSIDKHQCKIDERRSHLFRRPRLPLGGCTSGVSNIKTIYTFLNAEMPRVCTPYIQNRFCFWIFFGVTVSSDWTNLGLGATDMS